LSKDQKWINGNAHFGHLVLEDGVSIAVGDQPAVSQSVAPKPQFAGGKDPADFLDMLFPSSEKLPPGPEPPPQVLKTEDLAGEAAKLPNAKSQKLDSPQVEKKSKIVASPDVVLVPSILTQAAGATSPTEKAALLSQSDHGTPGSKELDAISTVDKSDSDSTLTQPVTKSLPVDPDVPITAIHVFSVSDPKAALSQSPLAEQFSTSPLNASVAEKLEAQNRAPAAPTGTPAAQLPTSGPTAANLPALTLAPGTEAKRTTGHIGEVASRGSEISVATLTASAQSPGSQTGSSGQAGHPHSDGKGAEQLTTFQTLDRSAKVSEVVAKFETLMATRPKNGVTVELAPKNLGSITFTLKTFGKAVDTQFSATNPDVRQALAGSRPDLNHAMNSRGYMVSGMSVTGQDAGSTAGGQSNRQSNQNPATAQSQFVVDPTKSPLGITRLQTQAPTSGVDLWI
jgi:flagellar hook-length control protein FliK